jgi:hypothetical protein
MDACTSQLIHVAMTDSPAREIAARPYQSVSFLPLRGHFILDACTSQIVQFAMTERLVLSISAPRRETTDLQRPMPGDVYFAPGMKLVMTNVTAQESRSAIPRGPV